MHIEVHFKFFKDKVSKGLISTSYTPILKQLVDIFAKVLTRNFLCFTSWKIGLDRHLCSSFRGNVKRCICVFILYILLV